MWEHIFWLLFVYVGHSYMLRIYNKFEFFFFFHYYFFTVLIYEKTVFTTLIVYTPSNLGLSVEFYEKWKEYMMKEQKSSSVWKVIKWLKHHYSHYEAHCCSKMNTDGLTFSSSEHFIKFYLKNLWLGIFRGQSIFLFLSRYFW